MHFTDRAGRGRTDDTHYRPWPPPWQGPWAPDCHPRATGAPQGGTFSSTSVLFLFLLSFFSNFLFSGKEKKSRFRGEAGQSLPRGLGRGGVPLPGREGVGEHRAAASLNTLPQAPSTPPSRCTPSLSELAVFIDLIFLTEPIVVGNLENGENNGWGWGQKRRPQPSLLGQAEGSASGLSGPSAPGGGGEGKGVLSCESPRRAGATL